MITKFCQIGNMELNEILRQLRKIKGVNQTQMAADLNVNPGTIAKYETGTRTPNVYMLKRLADYFGVSTDELLDRN